MLSKIYMFFFRSGSSVPDASAAACRLFSSEILIYVDFKYFINVQRKPHHFLSFGSTIFNKIATIAAGTIPEPPKISWIACGVCAKIAVFAPIP